jgi:aryl-alcohol dehydrogenase
MSNSFTTTAIVCPAANAPFELQEVVVPPLQPHECIVEMIASGICHTDLTCQSGGIINYFPVVLGHEGSGIVKAIGEDVKNVKVGDKVLMSFASCQQCRPCKSGRSSYCVKSGPLCFGGRRTDGTLPLKGKDGRGIAAQFFGQSSFTKDSLVNAISCVAVNDLSDQEMRQLAPLGCGLQTGSGAVFNTLQAKKGDAIAVFGSGGVGFGAMWAAKITGCYPIIAIDLAESRLELAKQLGATHTINPLKTPDVIKAIYDLTDGYGVEHAVETTGNEKVLRQCCDAIAAVGKVAVIGASPEATLHYEVAEFLRKGSQIMGVCMGAATPPTVFHLYFFQANSSTFRSSSNITAMDNSQSIGFPNFSKQKR